MMAATKSRAGQSGAPRENVIQAQVRLALGMEPDLVLWRNHTGGSEEYDHKTDTVRHQRFGLAPGSADLVGILAPTGRFVAFEVKAFAGRASHEQVQWLALVRARGGFAAVVRSADDARAALGRARRGESE